MNNNNQRQVSFTHSTTVAMHGKYVVRMSYDFNQPQYDFSLMWTRLLSLCLCLCCCSAFLRLLSQPSPPLSSLCSLAFVFPSQFCYYHIPCGYEIFFSLPFPQCLATCSSLCYQTYFFSLSLSGLLFQPFHSNTQSLLFWDCITNLCFLFFSPPHIFTSHLLLFLACLQYNFDVFFLFYPRLLSLSFDLSNNCTVPIFLS